MVLGFWSRDENGANPRVKRFAIVLGLALSLGVVAFAVWRVIPSSESFYTDADTIREPVAAAQIRDILWQPPAPLSDIINTTADDYEPRLSADGLTLFFVRGKASENAEIFTSRKTYAGWSAPMAITAINSEADDLGPEPSKDGKSLYFYSNREGTFGGYDLWVARLEGDAWTVPVNLGPSVNSSFNDYGPALTGDGSKLFFSSNRPAATDEDIPDPSAWSATLREDLFYRTYDLYAATIGDRGIGEAAAISELNTPFNEGAPSVSPFGDFLYFSSDRPGGEGAFDLYRSRSLHGDYQAVTNLGSSINTPANELDPALAMGGYALYFSSDRRKKSVAVNEGAAKSQGGSEVGRPEYNLFYSASREVFADSEQNDRDPIDWAALWAAIGPNLLWALLALLLLLAMLSLFRAMQDRRVSLLAKCLLASLAAHLLLLMLMNAWEVAAGIAGEFNRRGKIQIAIASPSRGDAIASQIRGELTQIEFPDIASPPPAQRVEMTTRPDAHVDRATLAVNRSPLAERDAPRQSVAVSDAMSNPQSESAIPERPVDLGQAPVLLAAIIPSESSRMNAAEKSIERQVQAEQSSTSVRANVDAPSAQASARIDMRPTKATVDLLQSSLSSVVTLAQEQVDRTPAEMAFVASGLPKTAMQVVDAELVAPAMPGVSDRMSEVAESQVDSPVAESVGQLRRVEISRDAVASRTDASPNRALAIENSESLLDDSEASKIDLSPDAAEAFAVEEVLVPEPSSIAVPAPSMRLVSDVATPQVDRVDENQLEKSVAEVKAAPGESLRSLPTSHVSQIAEASLAAVDTAVAPSQMPAEQLPESVIIADATPVDQPVAVATNVTMRANLIPPPMLSAMALPAIDPAADEVVEADFRKVDLSETLPDRLHSDVLASAVMPTPIPDAFFTDVAVPRLAWEDAPTRRVEDETPRDLAEIPMQLVLDDSHRLPIAFAATPGLKIETLAEEIEPQLESDDPSSDEIIGMLRGVVKDKETGEPLAGAQVRLTLPFVGAIVAVADRLGRYTMDVPEVPNFFAVSATVEGYVPETKSVSRDRVEGRRLRVNFELSPQDRATLVMEAIPDVHHLGDNRFEGRINSQFQKESEGDRYETTFTLQSDQLGSNLSEGEVVLLAKGVQRSHKIVINGEALDDRLDDAPSDGSFGEFVAWFDVSMLREGENTLAVVAKPSSSDIDDFEFVNVRVRLIQ